MCRLWEVFDDLVWNGVGSRGFADGRSMVCNRVVVLCDEVVECVLDYGYCGFGSGVCVRVEEVLPRRWWDMVRCDAGKFFCKVLLYYVYDLSWLGDYLVGFWVSD